MAILEMKSPYKAMAQRNSDYVAYVSMSELEANKAHLIYKIIHTNHETFGAGEMVIVKTSAGQKLRTQLPEKYLKTFTKEQIDQWYKDVTAEQLPYLIYRETLEDKSFRIDILPHGPEMGAYFSSAENVPEMAQLEFLQFDTSVESNELENQPDTKKDKIDDGEDESKRNGSVGQ